MTLPRVGTAHAPGTVMEIKNPIANSLGNICE